MNLWSVLVLVLAVPATFCPAQVPPVDNLQEVRTLIANRQLESAEKILVAQMMTEPQDAALVTLLAEVRLGQGRTREALTLAQDAERLDGPTAVRAQLTGLANSAMGRLDLAEPQFRKAIQLDPKFAPAHYFLARLLYTRNRFDAAIQESKTTITLSPDFTRAYENLGLCYEGKHDLKTAERWYREAIRLDAGNANRTEWPFVDLAAMLIHNDRASEAKALLDQALAINPHNAQALLQMGIFLEKSGDEQAALAKFRAAITSDGKLAGAYYHAARVCQKLGYREEAQSYFAQFKQISEPKH